jgi:hypothetical protein
MTTRNYQILNLRLSMKEVGFNYETRSKKVAADRKKRHRHMAAFISEED